MWRREACGGGLFTHVRADDVTQVGAFGQPHDQTVTHFGLSPAELATLARQAGTRGVDRLVPIGEALAFDTTWDGYDLIGDFLRRVTVRAGPQG